MVIPSAGPGITAAYAAIQDAKFEVAKLLDAGNDAEARSEAERLAAELTQNHPDAFVPLRRRNPPQSGFEMGR